MHQFHTSMLFKRRRRSTATRSCACYSNIFNFMQRSILNYEKTEEEETQVWLVMSFYLNALICV